MTNDTKNVYVSCNNIQESRLYSTTHDVCLPCSQRPNYHCIQVI